MLEQNEEKKTEGAVGAVGGGRQKNQMWGSAEDGRPAVICSTGRTIAPNNLGNIKTVVLATAAGHPGSKVVDLDHYNSHR